MSVEQDDDDDLIVNSAKDIVIALIKSSSDDDNTVDYCDFNPLINKKAQQRRLCSDLIQCLEEKATTASSNSNVREILGNLSGSYISRLPVVLGELLTNRIEAMELLPATQDERANAEVMFSSTSAMTISCLAMTSGIVYATMVGIPGGLGSGLVHIGALSGLSALVRRWSAECRGREPGTRSNYYNTNKSKRVLAPRNKKATKKKKANTPPKKRKRQAGTRRSARLATDEESSEEGEISLSDELTMATIHEDNGHEDSSTFVEMSEHSEQEANDKNTIVTDGLTLTLALSRALFLPEFRSWSVEAREALIDAATAALACASALSVFARDDGSESGQRVYDSCCTVVDSVTRGLETCIGIHKLPSYQASPSTVDKEIAALSGDDVDKTSSKNIVFVLRGLLPLLSFQAELPNGHKGRQAAFHAAVVSFQGIAAIASADVSHKLTLDTNGNSSKTDAHSITTQKEGLISARRSSLVSPSSRRRSLSGTPGNRSRNDENILIPSLKKTVTPKTIRFQRMSLGSKLDEARVRPRRMLSAIVGLLQKVATLSDLNKAESRSRAVSLIQGSLAVLPEFERSYFLRFACELCYSKRASHRIFAVELIGSILAEEWLWLYHCVNEPIAFFQPSEKTVSRDDHRLSHSSIWIAGAGNRDTRRCPPLALLIALRGRMSDASPAVRARAIHSLSTLIASTKSTDAASSNRRPFSQQARCYSHGTVDAMSESLKKVLLKRASSDNGAAVRCQSIVGLKNILLLECDRVSNDTIFSPLSRKDIAVLTKLCSDGSVAVRKAAAESITCLLLECSTRGACDVITDLLEESWASVVLVQATDEEATCAASAVQMFMQVVVNPIIFDARSGKDSESYRRYIVAWRILAHASERGAGSGRAITGALRVALSKVLQSEAMSTNSICNRLLKEMRVVALKSLDLFKTNVEGDPSPATERVQSLFEKDTVSQRHGVWCAFDALADCLTMPSEIKQKTGQTTFSLKKAAKASLIDGDLFVRCWNKLQNLLMNQCAPEEIQCSLVSCCRSCLRMISDIGTLNSIDMACDAKKSLLDLLASQQLSPDLISCAIRAVLSLTTQIAKESGCSDDSIRDACHEWLSELLSLCTTMLDSFFKGGPVWRTEQNKMCNRLERAVYSVGEVVLLGFSTDGDDTLSTLKKREADLNYSGDPIRGLYVKPSQHLVERIQALLPHSLPSMNADGVPVSTPPSIRAISIVTLGKLCLRDEALAKKIVNILLQEIHHLEEDNIHKNATVQSNALLVLGDLCVRYTNLVDRHLPAMAACLQAQARFDVHEQVNEFERVRTHAVLVLSTLVLQDFIKWRGLLFHRFLVATVDGSDKVAQIAKAILCGPLLLKQPNLFHNNFVEAIFVLNDCVAHPIYSAAVNLGENGAGVIVGFDGIKLFGSEGSYRRHQIYSMMLNHLTDEDKIGVTARLTKEVLGSALKSGDLNVVCKLSADELIGKRESMLPSERHRIECAINVLKDTLAVLTSPLCEVGRDRSADLGEDEDDSHLSTGSSLMHLAAVKGRLLTKISRKHMCEVVVPILCNLKSLLEDSRSGLLKELMMYLVHVYRRYKEEVKELLASNPILLQEIEYDTRRFEKLRRESQPVTKTTASQVVTPHPIFHL